MRRASLALILMTGCTDLSGYAAGPDDPYRGRVVGVEDPPVLRRGFDAETELTLSFDPRLATSLEEPPGRVTTSDGSLTDVPLEPIIQLTHDALSEYEIPAGGRVRNYIFVLRPDAGPLAGREPFVFLSLMNEGTVEVRIIAGGGDAPVACEPPDPCPYFGLWRLRRED